jgi:hypothetical protein
MVINYLQFNYKSEIPTQHYKKFFLPRNLEKQAWNLEALVKEGLHLISQFVWFLIKQACQVMWNWMSMDCIYLTTYGKNFKLNTVHSCTIHIWVWWPALNTGWGLHFVQPIQPPYLPQKGQYHVTCPVSGGIALHVDFFHLTWCVSLAFQGSSPQLSPEL